MLDLLGEAELRGYGLEELFPLRHLIEHLSRAPIIGTVLALSSPQCPLAVTSSGLIDETYWTFSHSLQSCAALPRADWEGRYPIRYSFA